MHHETVEKGRVIFEEGQPGRTAYRVLSGKVQIYVNRPNGRVVLGEIEAGDIFGEMAILQDRPRSASACTIETVELEVLTDYDFNEMILTQPARLLPYLASFFERLRHANELLRRNGIVSTPPPGTLEPGRIPSVRLSLETGSAALGAEPGLLVPKYPFRIGRALVAGESATLFSNDLAVVDKAPYKVSRSQCALIRTGPEISVRDRGSEHGTCVNGVMIGEDFPSETSAPLKMGRNEIRLGGKDGPHLIAVTLS